MTRTHVEYAVAATLALAFLIVAAIDVAVFPYHEWDALAYGEWSRLIAEHWRLEFPTITDQTYQRPLLYALQGAAWGVFGFSERLGRTIDLAFGVMLLLGVVAATRRLSSWFGGAVAAVLLLIVPEFQRGVASGLTDVPVAAMIALAGVAVLRGSPTAIGVTACLAALTKTSALPALAGLAAASLVGDRADLPRRVRRLVAPLGAGIAVALVYDWWEARHVHEGLIAFLRAGSTGSYTALAAQLRRQAVFGVDWLGATLRVLVLFALIYATVRAVAGVRHAAASHAALAGAAALAYLGPLIAGGFDDAAVGPFDRWSHALGFAALLATLAAAARAPDDAVPTRRDLQRLLLWVAPPFAVWAWSGAYDLRLLSPAWPPLIMLSALALHAAFRGSSGRLTFLVAPATATLVIAVAVGLENVDGIGKSGWNDFQSSSAGFFDLNANRKILLPDFARALDAARPVVGRDGRVFSSDGKFRFFFPGRATQSYPRTCSDLTGYAVFVLLTDGASTDYMEANHLPSDPAYWARCQDPKLSRLTPVGVETAFRVGPADD